MNRRKFFDMLDNHDNLKVIFYKDLEIIAMFDMSIESIEEYDDEIVIRGMGNTFVILDGEPKANINDDLEEEFIFDKGDVRVGIIF